MPERDMEKINECLMLFFTNANFNKSLNVFDMHGQRERASVGERLIENLLKLFKYKINGKHG